MLHAYWTSVCKFLSAEQKSSVQLLESSNNQEHADGNVQRRGIDDSEEAIGGDSHVICLNAPVAMHSQVVSWPGEWSCA
jgi:hypothetical protein